ncbi:MAG: tRNA (N6-isopentenyl adenosine(37)-C2)-methylthiotransferase MiaB [Polyangiaceae bacterium]|nr:tRNA (N6-isopentenyl adenosine(37)-C2)-methylthiotransferase MiaB [Polyangiaceae bacterium]
MQYWVTTFGCQMNVHDSDRMHEVMRGAGWSEAEEARAADVIVLNTCSVREKAEQKLLSELGRLAKLKDDRPGLLLVVAGCVAQQEGDKLLAAQRGVDLVLGPDNIPELPHLLGELSSGAPPLTRTVFDLDAPQFLLATSVAEGKVTSFVTTMKGCDERCSFCVVPYTRGPERYRPSADIVLEINGLVERGVREITLLGQTVNSYRDPSGALPPAPGRGASEDESEFAALLRAIAAGAPGLARLRYTSPHPRHLVPSLERAHAELSILPRHVHLPVQSGSDRVLKRMIRRYTAAEYAARAASLRAAVPGLTLSTDVIVGFPGETDEDFDATLRLVEELGFLGVFGFKYSRRPHTPALKLADDVPEAKKSERLARLFELSERLVVEHNAGLVGSRQRVLIEGPAKRAASTDGPARPHQGEVRTFTGRTDRNEIVHVDDPAAQGLVGEIVELTVARALKHSLVGELDAADRERGLAAAAALASGPRRTRLPVLSTEGRP